MPLKLSREVVSGAAVWYGRNVVWIASTGGLSLCPGRVLGWLLMSSKHILQMTDWVRGI